MADTVKAIVDSLTEEQRRTIAWPMPSTEERERWFYTPTDHGGLTLHSLAPHQHRLVMKLLACGLSRAGYVSVSTIIGLENVLDELEGFTSTWGFPRGRDPLRYFLRIFGEPGDDSWGWRLGGHHVSIHFTIRNDEVVSSTPCFLGADPASSPLLGGHHLRPLAACEDIARDLMASFSHDQLSAAIVSSVPPTDLVTANRSRIEDGDVALPLVKVWRDEFTGELRDLVERVQDVEEAKIGYTIEHERATAFTTSPKGLSVAAMTPAQSATLRELLLTYVGRVNDGIASTELARLDRNFASLHFAWAGSTVRGKPHYYRVQGHRLLAEYDNTTRDGNHVHTVWRDPVADFGRDALSLHLRSSHDAR